MADGLRRLDGVADVEVDLQANLCLVTPQADRLPDLAGLPLAVREAGFRAGGLWIEARGTVSRQAGGGGRFTIDGTDVALSFAGAADGPATVTGRVEFGATPALVADSPPQR
ncbi:MAG: heavy-metal-associated domain-containing protein [Planctomycetes bacterium]|nr:heavy-metal-associated domain-containing protein [Planctomycetota bacterium]